MEISHGSPQTIWAPLEYGTTVYVGGPLTIVESTVTSHEGMSMLPQATGANNDTAFNIPIGLAIGTNNRKPLTNSTGLCEYITSATPHDATGEFVLTGGPYILGGRESMVKMAVIDPCTMLKSKLVDASMSGAPAISTVSTGDAAGVSCTGSAASVAGVQGYTTLYFRSGANKGTYRVSDRAASTTQFTWDTPTYKDVSTAAPWDTYVAVNLLPFGTCRAQLLATYMTAFDINADMTGPNYFAIDVIRLDLSEQYKEWVEFRWNIVNFINSSNRA